MKALISFMALTATVPAFAQDHSGHTMPETPPAEEVDHSQHGAMNHGQMDHSQMDHGQPQPMDHSAHEMPASAAKESIPLNETPPPSALTGPAHAADAIWGESAMAISRKQLAVENGGMPTSALIVDRLEARLGDVDGYLWDAQAYYGSDEDKLWFKSEGEGEIDGPLEQAEIQALWSHAIGPFFDLQTGVRYDFEPEGLAHAVLGVQGLAPYFIEVDAAAFLSDKGDVTARIEAEYDQRITQRLILQPRAELELSAQDIPELELASGFTHVEAGVRLRYEFSRKIAPYVGVEYAASLGDTADLARQRGEDPDGISFLMGVRAWF